jgi:hypothetical protein
MFVDSGGGSRDAQGLRAASQRPAASLLAHSILHLTVVHNDLPPTTLPLTTRSHLTMHSSTLRGRLRQLSLSSAPRPEAPRQQWVTSQSTHTRPTSGQPPPPQSDNTTTPRRSSNKECFPTSALGRPSWRSQDHIAHADSRRRWQIAPAGAPCLGARAAGWQGWRSAMNSCPADLAPGRLHKPIVPPPPTSSI